MDKFNLTSEEIVLLKNKLPKSISNVQLFAKGKRGVVFKAIYEGNVVAVKVLLDSSDAKNAIFLESTYLKKVNVLSIGPRLIDFSEDYVIMEFVDGIPIGVFLQKDDLSSETLISIFKNIFNQLLILDKNGINKYELTNPYKHILIRSDLSIVLIDFERARFSEKVKNITQFSQYLISLNILKIIQSRGVLLDVNTFRDKIRLYSETGDLDIDSLF